MLGFGVVKLVVLVACFVASATSACVPDFSDGLLADAKVLQHPAVISAFEEVEEAFSALYQSTTRDGLSFAVVCSLNGLACRF